MSYDRQHAAQQTRSPEVPGGANMPDDQLPEPSFMVVPHYDALSGGLRRIPVAEADPLAGAAVAPGVVEALRRRQGGGKPLPEDLAGRWGGHFGQDLSALRVHTDPEAGSIAKSLQATAFTHGNDIYFAPGAYAPGSDSGRRVVAHEVGHAVAQRTGADRAAGGGLTVGAANDPAERAADRAAEGAMSALRGSPGAGYDGRSARTPAVRRSPGSGLLDDELTQTIQQGAALSVSRRGTPTGGEQIRRKVTERKAITGLLRPNSTVTLGEAIKDYNKRESKLTPSQRLDILNELARYLYQWYADQDTKDIAGLDGADAKAIRALEADLDKNHETGVEALYKAGVKAEKPSKGKAKAGTDPLGTRQASYDLLRQVASGNGPIKIAGDSKFQRRARSMLVKIMDSAMGKRLLDGIVATGTGLNKSVTIGGGAPPPELAGHLGEAAPTESKAVPQVTNVGQQEAGDLKAALSKSLALMTKLTDEPDDDQNYGAVTQPSEFMDAVLTGKVGIQVQRGNTTEFYKFGDGAKGVYVALIDKKLGEDTDNIGLTGNAVYTPQFVTLAHELGHALNILVGAGTIECRDLFKLFAGDVGTFEAPTATGNNWSNIEEYATINVVENSLRQQLGIELRGGHAAVINDALETRLQEMRDSTASMAGLLYKLGDNLKAITRGDQPRPARISNSEQLTLEELEKKTSKLRGEPIKGLSPTQKKHRCAQYGLSWVSGFKKLKSMSRAVRDESTVLLGPGGEFNAMKAGIMKYDPTALGSFA
ncbi:MAG: DUF4157 domain-containing protein [Dermatophilaceae bacterium]